LGVLYEGLDEGTVVVHLRDQSWYLFQACTLGGDPTSFAGNDLVAIAQRADAYGLKDSAHSDALSQFLQAFGIVRFPGLIGPRLQESNWYEAETSTSDATRHYS
jgi:hypothetical protein